MKQDSPKHIAIILDGNRRYAKKLMLEPWKGHDYGGKKVEELIDYAGDLGVNELTFYALSIENIKNRSEKELKHLYKLFSKTFNEINREKLRKNKTKIKFIGNLNLISEDLKKQCLDLEKETASNNNFIINFAIAYGGKQELVEAVKKIVKSDVGVEDINEELIEDNLWLSNEPDLVIRTGGALRTSNFLLWQSTYSEWFFLDKLWPEFGKEDLIECIEEFGRRKRNFGK